VNGSPTAQDDSTPLIGTDLVSSINTVVRLPASGNFDFSAYQDSGGNQIIIAGGGNLVQVTVTVLGL